MKAEGYREHQEEAFGWKINVVSYRLGERFHCTVDNVDPGARLARGEGQSREEAESRALEKARRYLSQTRRHPV
jgi:dsRNA-specific ribonuclease